VRGRILENTFTLDNKITALTLHQSSFEITAETFVEVHFRFILLAKHIVRSERAAQQLTLR
jgi:hypothetical protein